MCFPIDLPKLYLFVNRIFLLIFFFSFFLLLVSDSDIHLKAETVKRLQERYKLLLIGSLLRKMLCIRKYINHFPSIFSRGVFGSKELGPFELELKLGGHKLNSKIWML